MVAASSSETPKSAPLHGVTTQTTIVCTVGLFHKCTVGLKWQYLYAEHHVIHKQYVVMLTCIQDVSTFNLWPGHQLPRLIFLFYSIPPG